MTTFLNQTQEPVQDPNKKTPTEAPVPEPTHTPKVLKFLSVAALALSVTVMSAPAFANADILNRQLEMGSTGSDVAALQTFLAADPTLYPQGLVTGYFGFLSKSAVSNFQSRNGLPAVGRVGPMTLPVLNAQMANGSNSGADISAPAITNLHIVTKATSAEFRWVTSDLARGKLYYSTSPITLTNLFDKTGINSVEPSVSGSLVSYDGVARMSQTETITDLHADTKYYYVVVVLDTANNVSITVPSSFHTSK